MMGNRILNGPAISLAGLFFFFATIASVSQPQKTRKQATTASASSASGERGFASNCSGCHGLDGTGSQRAPNIVSNPQVQKLSTDEMFRIVSEGVPGTGMPAFKILGKPTITAIVAYVRNLEGKNRSAALPGNPDSGEVLFFGAGQCSNCHMAAGRGGFIAPDLSTFGQTHDAQTINAAITNPAARERAVGLVTVNTVSGERFEGILRNEDNFSLQLQAIDGSFHFLSKSDVKTIDRRQASMMPSDYGSKLSDAQLKDLVSYLLKLAQSSTPPDTHHPEED
jgi:putative heme-binding domain-containing protein